MDEGGYSPLCGRKGPFSDEKQTPDTPPPPKYQASPKLTASQRLRGLGRSVHAVGADPSISMADGQHYKFGLPPHPLPFH
jgi:hypothetical protein